MGAGTSLAALALRADEKGKEPLVEARTVLALGGDVDREAAQRVLEARGRALGLVEVEANLDPAEIARAALLTVGAAGAVVVGAGAAWLIWDGVAFGVPGATFQVWRGLKESEWWRGKAELAQDLFDLRLAQRGLAGKGDPLPGLEGVTTGTDDPDKNECVKRCMGGSSSVDRLLECRQRCGVG